MIKIALPKGRLGDRAYSMLSAAGYGVKEYDKNSRKLIFCDEERGVSLIWVKPADVATYVGLGAADVGVAGKDVLDETLPDVYELSDLEIGKCAMCVAAKENFKQDMTVPLRVATKYVCGAEKYFASKGRDVRIIKLNGSIELAPVLGISDVIFDIVETGETLRENGLKVIEKAYDISARLIANKASFEFKNEIIRTLSEKLKGAGKK